MWWASLIFLAQDKIIFLDLCEITLEILYGLCTAISRDFFLIFFLFSSRLTSTVIRMPYITSDSFPMTIWRIFRTFQRFRRGSLPVGNGNCSDHVVVGSPNICGLFAIPNYFDYPNWKSIYALPTTFSGSSAQMYLSFSTVSFTNFY